MNICVFCGSTTGINPIYAETARTFGNLIGNQGHTLVYGGGNIGLMGIVADSTLQAGGKVIGVIPDFLFKREVAHTGITELIVVDSMHERKKLMADKSDAFLALPGGWGTLDELAEILTWRQLHLIDKPIGILNVNGFFDPLLMMIRKMVEEGFLKEENRAFVSVLIEPQEFLSMLRV